MNSQKCNKSLKCISDFLLLHGEQTVAGSSTFSDASANDVIAGHLNSIPIEDIITTNTPQIIRSLKTFTDLVSDSIDVGGDTNEVSVSGQIKVLRKLGGEKKVQ